MPRSLLACALFLALAAPARAGGLLPTASVLPSEAAAPAAASGARRAPARPPQDPPPQQIDWGADRVEADFATGEYRLAGAAFVRRGPDEELLADAIVYNSRTTVAAAEGDIVLRSEGRVVRADRLEYDFTLQRGVAENARTIAEQALVRAERITIEPDRYVAVNAVVTTCPGPHPDFELFARELVLVPDERFTGRGVGVDLFGLRLFTVSGLSRSLSPEANERMVLPRFGRNSRDGFYLENDFTLSATPNSATVLNARLGTARGPVGGVSYGTAGELQLVAAAQYRERAPNQRARFLEVNRFPEVGLVWTPGTSPRAGDFLAHHAGQVRVRSGPEHRRRWTPGAELTVGYFEQRGGSRRRPEARDTEGARLRAQVQVGWHEVNLGPLRLEDARLLLRHSLYDTGDSFTVGGVGIGKSWRVGDFRFGIDRVSHFTGGSTPFLFDDVELREEWRPHAAFRSGRWHVSWAGRIDARRGGLYNYQVTLARATDCLEPRLRYDARRGQISLDLRILGLEPEFIDPDGVRGEQIIRAADLHPLPSLARR